LRPPLNSVHILAPILLVLTAAFGQDSRPAPTTLWQNNYLSSIDSSKVWTLKNFIAPRPVQGVYDWSLLFVPTFEDYTWDGSVRFYRFSERLLGGHGAFGVNFGTQLFDKSTFHRPTPETGVIYESSRSYRTYFRGDLVLSYPGIITPTIYGGAGMAFLSITRTTQAYSLDGGLLLSHSQAHENITGVTAHLGVRATILFLGADIQFGVVPSDEGMQIYRSLGLVVESDFVYKRFYKWVALAGVIAGVIGLKALIVFAVTFTFPF